MTKEIGSTELDVISPKEETGEQKMTRNKLKFSKGKSAGYGVGFFYYHKEKTLLMEFFTFYLMVELADKQTEV